MNKLNPLVAIKDKEFPSNINKKNKINKKEIFKV